MVFGTFQGMEWVLIFLIILLIFGPSKLPQLARGLGQAIYEFRKASQGLTESKREQEGKRSLEGVDEETLRKLAEKLGIKDADKKERDDLILAPKSPVIQPITATATAMVTARIIIVAITGLIPRIPCNTPSYEWEIIVFVFVGVVPKYYKNFSWKL